jgi:hypothetical protein
MERGRATAAPATGTLEPLRSRQIPRDTELESLRYTLVTLLLAAGLPGEHEVTARVVAWTPHRKA